MTAKLTISLTDQAHQLAQSLVERGQFASLSAVVQHALKLVQRDGTHPDAADRTVDAIRAYMATRRT